MALTKVTSTFIDTISSTQILKSGAVAGDVLSFDGPSNSWKPKTPTTGGTVTSVALSTDGTLEIKGSPITSSGTIGVSVSSIPLNKIARGEATEGQVLRWDSLTNTWKASALPAGSGTVTNIQVNSPDSSLQITGSPITTTGTIGASVLKVFLNKLDTAGATTGNVIAYNGAAWAANNTMYIAGGKVGLNTTSPESLFTVSGELNNRGGTLYTGAVTERVVTATIDTTGATAGTANIDLSLGTVFNINLSRSITKFKFTNRPNLTGALNVTFIITQGGTGNSVTWAFERGWASGTNNFRWAQGAAPTMTATNGKTDIYSFISVDTGDNWYGFVGGQNF
jgi:hypothetical protein